MTPSRLLKNSMTHKYSGAIPPTQLVDRSYSAYTGHWAGVPNPTNAVGGSFIYLAYRRTLGDGPENPTNAVGGSFILSLQTDTGRGSRIPPTELVDRSYSAYRRTLGAGPESHQRSWWIVHTQPTRGTGRGCRIPPTQLVDRSYSAYRRTLGGGAESHQRSWWIVHTQP
jgi:hypothetical protein